MVTEGKFQAKIYRACRDIGAVVYNIHPDIYMVSAMPDCFVAHPIWSGWLEVKGWKTVVKPLQIIKLKKLLRCEVAAYLLRWTPSCLILTDYELNAQYNFNWSGSGEELLQWISGI